MGGRVQAISIGLDFRVSNHCRPPVKVAPGELREIGQRLGRVWQDVDAHAERADLRRDLVDLTRKSRTLEEKREREPADTGTDDDDVQDISALEEACLRI